MRKILQLVTLIFLTLFLFSGGIYYIHAAEGNYTFVREITCDELDNKIRINVTTTEPIKIAYSNIDKPPRIILDPIGDIFSNLPEVKSILKGNVKGIRLVEKLEEKPESLDESYYSVDFFIIELEKPKPYNLTQDGNLTVLDIEDVKVENEYDKKEVIGESSTGETQPLSNPMSSPSITKSQAPIPSVQPSTKVNKLQTQSVSPTIVIQKIPKIQPLPKLPVIRTMTQNLDLLSVPKTTQTKIIDETKDGSVIKIK